MQSTNFTNRMAIIIDLKEAPPNISRLFDNLTVISHRIGVIQQIT